jgi:shikimate kinase
MTPLEPRPAITPHPGATHHPPLLLLIGLRASGKTTVGKLVAQHLHRPFIDGDTQVCTRLNVAHAGEAFATLGEPAFRTAEAEMIADLLRPSPDHAEPPPVVALGGGAPTAPGAQGALRDATDTRRARIVYLRNQPAVLAARLRALGPGANRPSLTGADPAAETGPVFQQRDPLYRSLATDIIEADRLDAHALVRRVIDLAATA